MIVEFINILSELYLSVYFFFFFTFAIFINLSKETHFPNYYIGFCCLVILSFFNQILIDIWNRLDYYNSVDLYKNVGDVYFKFFLIIVTILYLIYSNVYINKMKFDDFEYISLIFFVLMSFSFFIIVTDVISFYLLLEIQSFSFYLLTAFNKKNQYSIEAGLKYFVLSSFSSIFLLFGFSILYGVTGVLTLNEFYLFFVNNIWNQNITIIYTISIFMITLAILFKLYVAPFHIWISDIYQGSPTSSTAFFATVTSFPLFYFFSKYYFVFFFVINSFLYYFMFVAIIISMLVGSISALYQKKIKRLVAFSTVGNIGYILIGFLEENPTLLSNAFTYFATYILSTICLLVVFLNLYLKKQHIFLERFSMLSGFLLKNKFFAMLIIIIFFIVAGMPPFSLFFSKILLITGLAYNKYSVLFFVIVLSSILSSFYSLRIIKIISFESNSKYIFISTINYINSFILIFLIIMQLFFIFFSEKLTILTDYLVISII